MWRNFYQRLPYRNGDAVTPQIFIRAQSASALAHAAKCDSIGVASALRIAAAGSLTLRRTFAIDTSGSGAGALSESDFHAIADETLAEIEGAAGALDDILDRLDITNAMGVLTIDLGPKGTFVLNKQTPNKQIWWSSPVSGPRRFHWDGASSQWMGTRDGVEMRRALADELRALTGASIPLGEKAAPPKAE